MGAGNLIFPIQLGQLSGGNWLPATIGFLITGTVVPFLAMMAVSLTNSQSVYDIAKPVAPWFGTVFLVAIHLTNGPFLGHRVQQRQLFQWVLRLLYHLDTKA